MAKRSKMTMAAILLASCAACSGGSEVPAEPETPMTHAAGTDAPTRSEAAAQSDQPIARADSDGMSAASQVPEDTYLCEPQADGRHFFHLDPDDPDKGIVGFRYTDTYRKAHPDDTAPVSEMERAISGSGMRFTNSQMEFFAKGGSGMLTLADGKVLNCEIGN